MSSENETPARAAAASKSESAAIPSDALIMVPVRQFVLFPGVLAPIAIARAKSIAAAQQALREQRQVGILLQRKPDVDEPGPDDL
jgi:ATP-dependent Lon protease